jgi:RNA polymerase primary sigma factor/RNA polymerase sigma factor
MQEIGYNENELPRPGFGETSAHEAKMNTEYRNAFRHSTDDDRAVSQIDTPQLDQDERMGRHGPLSAETKQRVYQQWRRGAAIESLAAQFDGSQQQIRHAIHQERAQRIAALPLDFMPSAEFEEAGAAQRILAPMPEPEHTPRKARRPSDVPPYLASLYEVPLLTKEQEIYVFRKFNYLKYRASQLRNRLDPARPKVRLMDEIEDLHCQAVETKNQIIRANLRLVVAIAKKYVNHQDSFFDLVSDGNMSLIKAVEKFDYSLGNKFSTYGTWAIRKNYSRSFSTQIRHLERFRSSHAELLDATAEHRSNPYEEESAQRRRELQVGKILACLTDRERQIISSRFGLGEYSGPHTLKEVGADLGVSKERIRQLESRALAKLHNAAIAERIDSPAA